MTSESGLTSINTYDGLLKKTLFKLGPSSDLTGHVHFDLLKMRPIGGGGFADVYRCTYNSPDRGKVKVAVKRLLFHRLPPDTGKVLAKEIYIWSGLLHRNVVQFLGFILDDDGHPLLVSEFMECGTVMRYVKDHPEHDVIHLILGIAEGLVYLHEKDVVHGDIKSDNVLVNSSDVLGGNTTNFNGPGGSTRWVAYELIANSETYKKFTKESDVWAFGMTVYELLTMERPYAKICLEFQITVAVMRKELPSPPLSVETWPKRYQEVWKICELCWTFVPQERISMADAVKSLLTLGAASVNDPAFRKNPTPSAPRRIPSERLHWTLSQLSRLNITRFVTFDRSVENIIGLGCSSDVYLGTYEPSGHLRLIVVIKILRHTPSDSEVITRAAAREIDIWSKLFHPNVLPLLGYIIEENSLPLLVSKYMEGGSALKYVQDHPECDVIHLITGIAKGLSYLHENEVVHSDIKSGNILVSSSGNSVICNFGISRAMNFTQQAPDGNTTVPNGPGATARWMACELIVDFVNYNKPSKESDVWAFGITVSELLTKNRPYADISIDLKVLIFVSGGGLPTPPASFDTWPDSSKKVWSICKSCWIADPKQRIIMASVVEKLKALSSTEESDPPPVSEKDGRGINVDPKPRAENLTGSTLVPEVQDQKKMPSDGSDVHKDFRCTQADSEARRPKGLVVASAAEGIREAEYDNTVDHQIVSPAGHHPKMVTDESSTPTIAQDFSITKAEEPPPTESVLPETQVPSPPAGAAFGNRHEGTADDYEKEGVPPSNESPDRPKGPLARFFGGCLNVLLCR
ncbi:hypothetical protein M0805_008206 [Coniferiporia weirii]|nr:hypothetical protein M0805_008206 [Coniferiporia weirii]